MSEKRKSPTHGLNRQERLTLYRENLINSIPKLVQRRLAEKMEPSPRSSDKSVYLATKRVVAEIRRVSAEIGPVRKGVLK